jgi:predicted translin family RNA/ssDNA-binding protein
MKNLLKNLKFLEHKKKKREELSKKKMADFKLEIGELKEILDKQEYVGGEILKAAKEAINSTINDRLKNADKVLEDAHKKLEELEKTLDETTRKIKLVKADSHYKITEAINLYKRLDYFYKDLGAAKEEYYEAFILHFYLKDKKRRMLSPRNYRIGFETYAGAVADFCGELLRRARLEVIKGSGNVKENIEIYYQDTLKVYQALSNFSFSNKSGIRTKVENVKNYIKGLEDILYDLSKK